jgi:hypothetical protein
MDHSLTSAAKRPVLKRAIFRSAEALRHPKSNPGYCAETHVQMGHQADLKSLEVPPAAGM